MDIWAQQFERLGASVTRANLKSLADRKVRFISAIFDRGQINVISGLCSDFQPDAILVNQQYDEDGLDYISGALRSGIKNVASVMHMPMTKNKNQRPFGRLRGLCLRLWYKRQSIRLIFVSHGARAEFEAYYPSIPNSVVINNAAPLSDIKKPRLKTVRPHGGRPVIGFFGQFVSQKNLGMLVDAWSALNHRGLACDLLLVGEGGELQNIENKLKSAGIPSERWSIQKWTNSPETLYDRIDIFAMPSLFEGLPLGLVEAAARGLPCVITPFNGANDVAQRASWVHISNDHQLQSFEQKLFEVVKDVELNDVTGLDQTSLEAFRKYFSISRMATEYADVLGVGI